MPTTLRTLTILLFLLSFVGNPIAQGGGKTAKKKPLAIEDLYLFDNPRSLALSPDGQNAVYIRNWIDAQTRQERHSLWLVEGKKENHRALEADEPDARAPVYSPDGKWIAFLSTRLRPAGWKAIPPVPLEADPATDIWLIPPERGGSIPLAGRNKPYGRVFNDGFYGRMAFSADGKKLVFVADDGVDPRTPEEKTNQVEIVRPDQGEGYGGYGPAQIWIAHLDEKSVPLSATRIERLTHDEVWYGDPQWSPDGKTVVVHANKTSDRESVRFSINKNFDLWAIDVATGKQTQLTTGPGPEVSPRFSPDGKTIACLSAPRKGPHRDTFNLAIVTLAEGGPRTTVLFDHHGPGAEKAPHRPPAFPLPDDCWEGNHSLVYSCELGTVNSLQQVDVRTGHGGYLIQPAPTSNPIKPTSVVLRRQRREQLTPLDNLFLKERYRAPVDRITWENDGCIVEGVLTFPPVQVAKKPFKLLVYPHGGPHSRSTEGFDFTAQLFAAHGYLVFQPNFRGSSGYGQKFLDADRFDFGGGDMRDILSGVDFLIRTGTVDKNRQFVYGTSYGGFLTTWLVGQTNQFRAAVAQNAVTDLNMMWALSDLQSWTQWEFGGLPWEVPEKMRQHSPLTHVARVQTPTLILHARGDRRVPLSMGRAYHQALLARGVPTQMVIYPNEGHGIRQPRHREDVLRRVLAWFEQHGK